MVERGRGNHRHRILGFMTAAIGSSHTLKGLMVVRLAGTSFMQSPESNANEGWCTCGDAAL